MAWDPTQPPTGSPLLSAPIRGNFEALDAFMNETSLGARVYNSAAIAVPDDVEVILTFNSERYDTGDSHSTTLNPARLTVPIAGRYLFFTTLRFAPASGVTYRGGWIYVNAKAYVIAAAEDEWLSPGTAGGTVFSMTGIQALAAGDYLRVAVWQANIPNASMSIQVAAQFTPEFAIHYLGPP
jgi:hypothetical protein